MKISKSLGLALYSLFGRNGGNLIIAGKGREFDAMKELERHGLVTITDHHTMHGLVKVDRVCRGLDLSLYDKS